jgi:hypothetical protein
VPKPISSLNLFPTYETREAYERATGQPCPAWDASRKPKSWMDPNAKKALMVGGVPYALYPNVYVSFDQIAGQPVWDQLGLPVTEAKTVNIPPKGEGQTNVPGADQPEVPCPMRDLTDDEVIRLGFAAIPQVWRADEMPVAVAEGFTAEEKKLLLDAARKVLAG